MWVVGSPRSREFEPALGPSKPKILGKESASRGFVTKLPANQTQVKSDKQPPFELEKKDPQFFVLGAMLF